MLGRIAKHLLPEIAIDTLGSIALYRNVHGTLPNLLFPRKFNEKVIYRALFDRRAILKRFADKYAARSYVAEKIGPQILPKVYHVTSTPTDIPFDALPDRFVVKPTHGAGWVHVVWDKARLNVPALIEECKGWLSQNFYEKCRERIYKDIPRRILVEEFIDDGRGGVPVDYKFLVFRGRVEFITPVFDRFGAARGYFLDRNWNVVDAGLALTPQHAASAIEEEIPPPRHLTQMIEVAEKLADGIEFVRVDLYDTPEKIVFGEMTATPGAGLAKFSPPSFDRYLGSFW
jgi:hypothetical protein